MPLQKIIAVIYAFFGVKNNYPQTAEAATDNLFFGIFNVFPGQRTAMVNRDGFIINNGQSLRQKIFITPNQSGKNGYAP